jgi:hypothetical protein
LISPSGGGGGTLLASPKAFLGFKDTTPKKGSTVKAKAGVKVCNAKTKGTTIKLQKKSGSSYKSIKSKKLDSTCRAIFKVKASFKKATFRTLWPKQHGYKEGHSKDQTVITHP